jgi:hypothetical protein
MLFSNIKMEIPKLDYPITPLENFERVVTRNNPLWAPNSQTDFQNLMFQDLAIGEQIGVDFHRSTTENYDFIDWFGVPLRFIVSAAGRQIYRTPICLTTSSTGKASSSPF